MTPTGTLRQFAEHLGVPYGTLRQQVRRQGVQPVDGRPGHGVEKRYRLADVTRAEAAAHHRSTRRPRPLGLTGLTDCRILPAESEPV